MNLSYRIYNPSNKVITLVQRNEGKKNTTLALSLTNDVEKHHGRHSNGSPGGRV